MKTLEENQEYYRQYYKSNSEKILARERENCNTEEELSLTEKSIKDVKTGVKLYIDKEICEIIDDIEASEKINQLKGLTISQLEEEKDEKVKN